MVEIRFKTKPFINKKNKQISIVIPKKKIKGIDPTIKFSNNIFIELRILKEK